MRRKGRVCILVVSIGFILFLIGPAPVATPVRDVDGMIQSPRATVSDPELDTMSVASYSPHDPIKIHGDSEFAAMAQAEGWPGDGTQNNPYIIERLEIDSTGLEGSSIFIFGTQVHFRIINCRLTGAQGMEHEPTLGFASGIHLVDVMNGYLADNLIIYSNYGIGLGNTGGNDPHYHGSSYSMISGNNFIDCGMGIGLFGSSYNAIHGNTGKPGLEILLYSSSYNTIDGNLGIPGIITLFGSSSNTIIGNTLSDGRIELFGSSYNTVDDNLIHECWTGISISPWEDPVANILLYPISNTITRNVITNGYDTGIIITDSSDTVIDGNTISHIYSGGGIIITDSSDTVIDGNTISHIYSGVGIDITYCLRTTVSSNEIFDIQYGDGLSINISTDTIVMNNEIFGCGDWGIRVTIAVRTSVGNNGLMNNGGGFDLDSNLDIEVVYNALLYNGVNAQVYATQGDKFISSNLWSDYGGVDADNDGIGDTPYVGEGFEDLYPLTRLSGYHLVISIDGDADFVAQAQQEGWSGDGSHSYPYVIENYWIPRGLDGYCISIKNLVSTEFVIRNCYLTSGVYGVYLVGVETSNTVEGSTFLLNDYGIYAEDVATHGYTYIVQNEFRDNVYAIYQSMAGAGIYMNEFDGNEIGVYVDGQMAMGVDMDLNIFSENRYHAIHLYHVLNVRITGNNIVSEGGCGILLEDSSGNSMNTIQGNKLHSQYGIYLTQNSGGFVITDNVFRGELADAVDNGSSNVFEGNVYWSYLGTDADYDDIGDTAHPIAGIAGNQDLAPHMGLRWANPPTDQIVDVNQRFEYGLDIEVTFDYLRYFGYDWTDYEWSISSTPYFSIDNEGIVTNVASLSVRNYYLEVSVRGGGVLTEPFYVRVGPDPYDVPIAIDGDVALIAKSQAMGWSGDGTYNLPYIIDNLRIHGADGPYCISVKNIDSTHFAIRNCYLTGAESGVYLEEIQTSPELERNTFFDNHFGIYALNQYTPGYTNIIENGFYENDYGIYQSMAGAGIYMNEFDGNEIGVYVEGPMTMGVDMNSNIILDNEGHAIHLYNVEDVIIQGNTLSSNHGCGILLELCSGDPGMPIQDNIILHSDYGIYLAEGAGSVTRDFTIRDNAIRGELADAYDDGLYNVFVGNLYWSYDGTDVNHDGVGDIPHLIPGTSSNQDPAPEFGMSWTPTPSDQTINLGEDLSYDLNIDYSYWEDHEWTINNTAQFSVDSQGVVTNIVHLSAGDYPLEVTVRGGGVLSGVFTLSVNQAPVATDDAYITDEDVPLIVELPGVLTNDVDADLDTLTAVLVTEPSYGVLTLNPDGSFTYTPDLNWFGEDSFVYEVSDGTLSDNATVTITVNSVNDYAMPVDDYVETDEDTSVIIDYLANDYDVDGDSIRLIVWQYNPNELHGTITWGIFEVEPGVYREAFRYTPDPNWYGSTSTLRYVITDGTIGMYQATIYITVNPVNDAPVAVDDFYTTLEDLPFVINFLTNDDDVDGDLLSVVLLTTPQHGVLLPTGASEGDFVYVPDPDFNGEDSFTYEVSDGTLTDTATVTIIVNSVNDAPVAVDDRYITDEDAPFITGGALAGVLYNDSDVDSDSLVAILVSGPSEGAITLNADGSFIYAPNLNFNGADSFTYRVSDGELDSNVATVTITVNPVNDAPVAVDDFYTTLEDKLFVIDILLNDSDIDGDSLSMVLLTIPLHGVLLPTGVSEGNFVYVPDLDFNGEDSFTYEVSDGTLTDTATVTITVNSVNDAPMAEDDAYVTDEDTFLQVYVTTGLLANDTDVEGDALTAVLVTGPSHGSLVFNADGSFTYTPDPNWFDEDSFVYEVSDGILSDTATVIITVNSVNDAPVAVDDYVVTDEDTPVIIDFMANDYDIEGDSFDWMWFSWLPDEIHGWFDWVSIEVEPGVYRTALKYTPDPNWHGTSTSVEYGIIDSLGAYSSAAHIYITVNSVPDVPVALDDAYAIDEDNFLQVDSATGVLANDTDGDGDPLTVQLVSGPSHGSLTLNPDGSFTYTPNSNFNGEDSFTYRVSDGNLDSNVATVTITVIPVNDAPVAEDDAYVTDEDTLLQVYVTTGLLANDTDIDGDLLQAVLEYGPANGVLTLNPDGSFTYTPNLNFNGEDSFTYRVSDGNLDGNVAAVIITVNPVNDAPVAVDDYVETDEDTPVIIDFMANDYDVDGNAFDWKWFSWNRYEIHGQLVMILFEVEPGVYRNVIRYTPNPNWHGSSMSMQYAIIDSLYAQSSGARIYITVNPVNDAPVAVSDSYVMEGGTVLSIEARGVLLNDTDIEGDALTSILDTLPSFGTLTLSSDGSFTYVPDVGFAGVDEFTYHANDGGLDSNVVTVTITVIDTTPPSTEIIVGLPYYEDVLTYVTSSSTLTLVASDSISDVQFTYYRIDGGAWVEYSPFYLLGDDGTHTIDYYSVDHAGNAEPERSCTLYLDNTSSQTILSLTGVSGTNDWFVTSVEISFTSDDGDGSGTSSIYYILDSGPTLPFEGSFPFTENGYHTVKYWSVDNLGNTELVKSTDFKIDTEDPTTVATLGPASPNGLNGWYVSPVTLYMTADDSMSGVWQTYYMVNDGAAAVYDSPVLFSLDDTYKVEYWSVDNAGNIEAANTLYFQLDQINPITTLTIQLPRYGSDPTYVSTATDFVLDSADPVSGVERTEYRIDTGTWEVYGGPFNVDSIGLHTIYYRSVDNASNVETEQAVWICVNASEITYTGEVTGNYSDLVYLEASLVDIATQLPIPGKTIVFTIGGQTDSKLTGSDGVASVTIILNQPGGVYTVSATFEEDEEYLSSSETLEFIIEKEYAYAQYTGSTVVPTTVDTITLRATVFDDADGYWGDLTRIYVTFTIYSVPLDLANPIVVEGPYMVEVTNVEGVGVAIVEIPNLSENGYVVQISFRSEDNSYYQGPDSDLVIITVYEPTGDFVTGGGWIWDPSGSKGNFGFNVKYKKNGLPRGQLIYVYRSGEWEYIIKSTAWLGMAIVGNHSFFEAKCVVQQYNSETGELLWGSGNYQLRVDVWDDDKDGGVDVFQIRVLDKNGLVWHEAGFDPYGFLQGGNITIHIDKKD